ncbi:MAG: hypothetical protein AABX48_03410 [Nanoarchaeota archaeon]
MSNRESRRYKFDNPSLLNDLTLALSNKCSFTAVLISNDLEIVDMYDSDIMKRETGWRKDPKEIIELFNKYVFHKVTPFLSYVHNFQSAAENIEMHACPEIKTSERFIDLGCNPDENKFLEKVFDTALDCSFRPDFKWYSVVFKGVKGYKIPHAQKRIESLIEQGYVVRTLNAGLEPEKIYGGDHWEEGFYTKTKGDLFSGDGFFAKPGEIIISLEKGSFGEKFDIKNLINNLKSLKSPTKSLEDLSRLLTS